MDRIEFIEKVNNIKLFNYRKTLIDKILIEELLLLKPKEIEKGRSDSLNAYLYLPILLKNEKEIHL